MDENAIWNNISPRGLATKDAGNYRRPERSIEVIADDFLVIGRGETQEAAMTDHDQNLMKFLDRARERNLKLSLEKARLRLTEVTYVGHRITAKRPHCRPQQGGSDT